MEIFIWCVCVHICVCVCVCPKPSHSSSSTLVYKSKSSLGTCLLAIHNITHSLSFWTIHIIRTTKAGTIAWWKEEPSFLSFSPLPSPPLLPLYSPSLELAFSAASWNVSMRRVRSQGRFHCAIPFQIEVRVEGWWWLWLMCWQCGCKGD